jgi:hypothetical protein
VLRTFFIKASRQAGKAFLAEQHTESIDADSMSALGQLALDVIDGQIAFAHGDDEFADRITSGGIAWPVPHHLKETSLLASVVTELMAEDTKRPNRIAEAACHFVGGELFHEVGAQSLVLTVARVIGREKEASFGRYSITMTGIHTVIMLAAGLAAGKQLPQKRQKQAETGTSANETGYRQVADYTPSRMNQNSSVIEIANGNSNNLRRFSKFHRHGTRKRISVEIEASRGESGANAACPAGPPWPSFWTGIGDGSESLSPPTTGVVRSRPGLFLARVTWTPFIFSFATGNIDFKQTSPGEM